MKLTQDDIVQALTHTLNALELLAERVDILKKSMHQLALAAETMNVIMLSMNKKIDRLSSNEDGEV